MSTRSLWMNIFFFFNFLIFFFINNVVNSATDTQSYKTDLRDIYLIVLATAEVNWPMTGAREICGRRRQRVDEEMFSTLLQTSKLRSAPGRS